MATGATMRAPKISRVSAVGCWSHAQLCSRESPFTKTPGALILCSPSSAWPRHDNLPQDGAGALL
jgi:hypothetical protein